MRQTVLRWVSGVGAIAVVGAVAAAQGPADAAPSAPAHGASVTSPAAYVPPKHDLFFGDTGAAVKSVQRRLNQLRYYAGPDDGVYGQDLQEAVWAFKEAQGLPMNQVNWNDIANSNSVITWAFRKALVHPKAPKVLIKHGPANRIEINLADQVLVLYKNNHPRWILHVSPGGGYHFCNPPSAGGGCGRAVTPDGNFHAVYFYSGWQKVPLGTMFNPVYFDPAAGDAIHGDIPVPWYAASHGCVRIWMDAAAWFYKDLTIGGKHATPVYIRGKAHYWPQIVGS